MLRNYLIASLRHLRKSSLNFFFKLAGLSLALFCVLAITIYVSYQVSFDQFHKDADLIYRVTSERKDNGILDKYVITPMAIGPMIKQLPEVTSAVRIRYANATYLRKEHEVFDCETLIEADSTIFDVFTLHFVKGNKRALMRPRSMVLTRSLAERIFGTTDVLEKTLTVNGDFNPYAVTAVIEDPPTNFHLSIGAITSNQENEAALSLNNIADPVNFSDQSGMLYIKLSRPMDPTLRTRTRKLLDRYLPQSVRKEYGFDLDFQAVTDIYLGPRYRFDPAAKGSPVYLYAFSTLGILLLLVALINYVNLSIADFKSRSRETGVRRVLGATNRQLILQSALEALFFGLLSILIAIGALYLLFPKVAQLLEPELKFNMLYDPTVLSIFGVAFVLLMIVATWLPARQLRTIRLTQEMKSAGAEYNSFLSRVLLFTQFAVSALCLCCAIVIGTQVNYIFHKPLGFERKNLLTLSMPEEFTVQKLQAFKVELKQIPAVTSVSNSSFRIGSGYWKDWYFVEDGARMKQVELYEVFSDDELFTTMGIPVLKGRTFKADIPSDSGTAFVINETAAKELGWDDPIGKRIYTHPEEKGKWDGTVVGVVADLNISALNIKVRPLVMRLPWQNRYPDMFMYVRYQGDDRAIAKAIEEKYKVIMPGFPLMLRYVDELFNSRHEKEIKAYESLRASTLVIVLVSMLGIFSMAAFMSMRRMKEFGIRKVLGASAKQIAVLHTGYFIRIALAANAISLPLAYWVMKGWLRGFVYKVELTALPFLVVAVVSVLIVVISGGYSAIKSGMMNPVEVIKMD